MTSITRTPGPPDAYALGVLKRLVDLDGILRGVIGGATVWLHAAQRREEGVTGEAARQLLDAGLIEFERDGGTVLSGEKFYRASQKGRDLIASPK